MCYNALLIILCITNVCPRLPPSSSMKMCPFLFCTTFVMCQSFETSWLSLSLTHTQRHTLTLSFSSLVCCFCFILLPRATCHTAETHVPHSWTSTGQLFIDVSITFYKSMRMDQKAFILKILTSQKFYIPTTTEAISSQFWKMTSLRNDPHSFLDFEIGCIFLTFLFSLFFKRR